MKFYKKFFSYAGVEGFAKGLNWLTIATIPVFLPANEYGVVGLLVAIEGLLNTVLSLGQGRAILRHTSTFKEKMLPYSLQLITLSGIFIVIVAIIVSFFRSDFMGIPMPYIFISLVSLFLYNLSTLTNAHALATDNAAFFRKSRLWYQGIKFIAVLAFCMITKKGISYVYGSLLAGILFALRFYKEVFKHFDIKKVFVFDKNLKYLLIFGLPLIFHALSGNILSYSDRFFVESYLNKSQLGIYTFVYSLGSSIFFFYGSVGTFFEPLVYKNSADKPRYHTILKFYLTSVLMCATLFSIMILLGSKYFAGYFVSKEYISGFSVLSVVLGAHLLIPFYHLGNYELTVLNKTSFIAVSTICSAVLNLLLNIWLIPKMGITGAALSTFFTYAFLAIVCNGWSTRISGISKSYLSYLIKLFIVVNAAIVYANYMIDKIWIACGTFFILFIILGILCLKQVPVFKLAMQKQNPGIPKNETQPTLVR